ncbi:MAG: helix-turn-helix domain-containing protein [Solibacillus sp.]
MNTFEEIIRVALIQKKMSLTELAEKVEMSQPNFSKKLKKNNFNETDMRKIADALGMELLIKLEDGTKI